MYGSRYSGLETDFSLLITTCLRPIYKMSKYAARNKPRLYSVCIDLYSIDSANSVLLFIGET